MPLDNPLSQATSAELFTELADRQEACIFIADAIQKDGTTGAMIQWSGHFYHVVGLLNFAMTTVERKKYDAIEDKAADESESDTY